MLKFPGIVSLMAEKIHTPQAEQKSFLANFFITTRWTTKEVVYLNVCCYYLFTSFWVDQ